MNEDVSAETTRQEIDHWWSGVGWGGDAKGILVVWVNNKKPEIKAEEGEGVCVCAAA